MVYIRLDAARQLWRPHVIVDVHTHLATHDSKVPPDEERVDTVMRMGSPVRMTNSIDDYLKAIAPVDRALLFGIAALPESVNVIEGVAGAQDVNNRAAAIASRSPDKIIGFMSVHPNDPAVMDEMERCVNDLKLRGMKLGPNYQVFDPLGEEAKRVYGYAERQGLPIVFHQGTSPFPNAPLRYAHPLVMDEVAMAFPDLKIVMAHMGHPWHADCIAVVRKHPNVYADVSGQLYRPWSMYNSLRLAYEWGVMHKLLFASDWPLTTPAENIDALRGFNGFARQHHLPEVPDDLFEGIINRDSLSILGLS